MPKNKGEIEIRSDEVQEIMSHVPHWMIRWGISLIFIIIILLIFISWFVKYPDVIQGKATISTEKASVKLVTKTAGEIENIYLEDRSKVNKGDLIAAIGDAFDERTKDYLIAKSDEIKRAILNNKFDIVFDDNDYFFGALQKGYTDLKTSVLEYQYFIIHDPTNFEIETVKEQISNHTQLRSVSIEQLNTAKKELSNATKKYAIEQKLFEEKIVSQIQMYEEEQKLIQAENNVGNFKKSVVQSAITITDLKKELNSLVLNRDEKKIKFIQLIELGLANINNAISEWGRNYQMIAAVSGELNYLQTITKHEYIAAGTSLFAIVPNNQDYIGYIDVPLTGYGKLKIGQKLRVSIDKYPYQDYGLLEGTISQISLLPNENNYRVQFNLKNGMKSSYGRTFQYTPEMSGNGDIITEDIRLLERIFNKFRKVFD